MEHKYTAKYFSERLPEWKRKRDPIVVRTFFRPLSFPCSAIFSNMGLTANDVTIISIIVALIADTLFFMAKTSRAMGVAASILISVWLLLDCSDGNMARSVRKQPYGEFLDALGSYILVAFLGVGLGRYVFYNGGLVLTAGSITPIFVGTCSSIFDLLMRTTHQKYIVTGLEYSNKQEEKADDSAKNTFTKIKDRVQLELGIGGILPPIILVCAITNTLDLVSIYLLLYNGLSCVFIVLLYIHRTMKLKNQTL